MFLKNIPNLFTMCNLFFGFMSILYSAQGDYKNAAILILIGMMLDSMDGRLARMLNAISDFGKELDSLADIVTFGVAPAVMVYYAVFAEYGVFGMALTALFPLFGAYRLARFNVQTTNSSIQYFTGVPITAGGGILTLLTLIHPYLPEIVLPIAFTAICFLMVSRVKVPSLKSVPLPKYGTIVTVFLGYALYLLWKGTYEESPVYVYIASTLYVVFIGYQFVKQKAVRAEKRSYKKSFKS